MKLGEVAINGSQHDLTLKHFPQTEKLLSQISAFLRAPRFVSHMRSAPSKSSAQNIVCGSVRGAALRLWRDFIIGSYRMGRDVETATEIDPENLPPPLLLCHINEHTDFPFKKRDSTLNFLLFLKT